MLFEMIGIQPSSDVTCSHGTKVPEKVSSVFTEWGENGLGRIIQYTMVFSFSVVFENTVWEDM